MPVVRDLFLTPRFFWVMGGLAAWAAAGYVVPPLFAMAPWLAAGAAGSLILDVVVLRTRGRLTAERQVAERLSNGDENEVRLRVESTYPFPIRGMLIDEAPVEFQRRDLRFDVRLDAGGETAVSYFLRPTRRGAYAFGHVLAFATGPLGLGMRRFRCDEPREVKVYPSFLQMHRYQLLATSNRLEEAGVKRIRRVGRSMEFDQIREYVPGDDHRTVNWKATARRDELMVNQYQEERSQPVYALIDLGRTMRPAFGGMTLLDHAINASLVLLNIALVRGDRAGLIAFGPTIETVVPAERRPAQRYRLLEALYRQQTRFLEPSYEALYTTVRRHASGRALLVLFANFETVAGLRRQLPTLQLLSRTHLVVAVFFENVGLDEIRGMRAASAEDVYVKAVAERLAAEKRAIVGELRRHGIRSILTRPEQLTVDVLNRYLEIKAQGVL